MNVQTRRNDQRSYMKLPRMANDLWRRSELRLGAADVVANAKAHNALRPCRKWTDSFVVRGESHRAALDND